MFCGNRDRPSGSAGNAGARKNGDPMISNFAVNPKVICCDADPDSRQKLAEAIGSLGFAVLATGKPQIAAGLVREQDLSALVVAMGQLKLSMISVIVEARRSKPSLPIVVILSEGSHESMPPGLADVVLVGPSDKRLEESLRAFTERTAAVALAC